MDGLVLVNGWDSAILGLGSNAQGEVVVYDRQKVLSILREEYQWSLEEAESALDYAVDQLDYGARSPVFVDLNDPFFSPIMGEA